MVVIDLNYTRELTLRQLTDSRFLAVVETNIINRRRRRWLMQTASAFRLKRLFENTEPENALYQ